MHVIVSHFSDDSMALIQWAKTHLDPSSVSVVTVDTGWLAPEWQQRVQVASDWVKKSGFQMVKLISPAGFSELVKDRQQFPSIKYQWCAGFLKGLPLIDWLDRVDPACEAVILLAKRKAMSPTYTMLPERIDESPHFGDRTVWHPLLDFSDQAVSDLVGKTGFPLVKHRSLECEPCTYSRTADLARLSAESITRAEKLEQMIGQPMFSSNAYDGAVGIRAIANWSKSQQSEGRELPEVRFDMGCGAPFGCGI